MTDGVLKRTQYWNLSLGTIRNGATGHGESLTDVENYQIPMDAARDSAFHDWGVAAGLTVTTTIGAAGVTVTSGTALDAAGRLIRVAPGGSVVTDPGIDPTQIQNVTTVPVPDGGVVLPTDPAAIPGGAGGGHYALTVTWLEVQGTSALANAPVMIHSPWLRLVFNGEDEDQFDDDGEQVLLAFVDLDAAGLVTGLRPGWRRLTGVPTGTLRLSRPRLTGGAAPVVDQVEVAEWGLDVDGSVRLGLSGGGVFRTALSVNYTSAVVRAPFGLATSAPLTLSSPGNVETYAISAGADGKWHLGDTTAGVDRLVVDAGGSVGIGIGAGAAARTVHVEGSEVHSGGGGGGFSFSDRDAGTFMETPNAGQRWVLYALDGSARLWSGGDVLSVSATNPSIGVDIYRRMRVRQGGDPSAGIWFYQSGPNNDRAFVGMADDTHVGFYGNTGAGWGLEMDTHTGEVSFSGDFGHRGATTVNIFGSTISDRGGGTLSIRSGGGIVAFDGGDTVRILGNLQVTGAISKNGGGFTIDHPLAPDSRLLSHSFVESPEMMTVYAGSVTTDEAGLATVTLPEYFDALNADARVQLTTVRSLSRVTVETPVKAGEFAIRSEDPSVLVSWLVTGTRKDAWAEANRIVVEEDKAEPSAYQQNFLAPTRRDEKS